ncbi:cytochrome c oxidase subunit 7C%2C mitochondrial [Xyrichtys novacula]|nr:cytochrome c oxidase subunit 7C%2C mitochondrial [Xyrichtys novacula]
MALVGFQIVLALSAQTPGSSPAVDSALMDVAAMTRGNQLAAAITITAYKKVAHNSSSQRQEEEKQTEIMLGQAVRRFTTSAVRSSHYAEGPGKNLPFSVDNKWRLLGMMVVFFGSGFAFPFIVVRHQILKK